jgi:hypothetical protein
LEGTDPAVLGDGELGDILSRLHHVPPGEIYQAKPAQMEHGLHAAIRTHAQATRCRRIG